MNILLYVRFKYGMIRFMFNKSFLTQVAVGLSILVQSSVASASGLSNPSVDELVPAINGFSYDFFRQVVKSGTPHTAPQSPFAQENRIISGPSVHMALSLAYMGTGSDRNTQSELAQVLHYSEFEKGSVADSYSRLFDQILTTSESNSSGSQKNDIMVEFANQVLASNEFTVQDSFQELLKPFRAIVEFADFVHHPKAIIKDVNAWVSAQTHGKIKSILESLKPTDKMLLLSTVYFKGAWQKTFARTGLDAFYTDSDKSICLLKQASLMHKIETDYYYEDDKQQVLELPYLSSKKSTISGNDHSAWSLFLVLPKAGVALADVQESLNPSSFASILDKMTQTKVDIALPKFKLEAEYDLKDSLKALGIEEAFTKRADFSAMMHFQALSKYDSEKSSELDFLDSSNPSSLKNPSERAVPFMISDVKNKVFIELDEKGTEAASVVAISFRVTSHISRRGPAPKEFRADHPFYFMLRNNETGLILFQGVIANPVL